MMATFLSIVVLVNRLSSKSYRTEHDAVWADDFPPCFTNIKFSDTDAWNKHDKALVTWVQVSFRAFVLFIQQSRANGLNS